MDLLTARLFFYLLAKKKKKKIVDKTVSIFWENCASSYIIPWGVSRNIVIH